MIIENWWPQHIAYCFNPNHSLIENELTNHCLKIRDSVDEVGQDNWISNTYNSPIDIYSDKKFFELNVWVEEQVKLYIKKLKMFTFNDKTEKLIELNNNKGGWFNIYEKNSFQEYHSHNSLISCIYYLKSNTNDAKTWFESPVNDQLFIEYPKDNNSPNGTVFHSPKAGKLLIFRGYVRHCVEQKQTDDLRITLAYNFNRYSC